MLPLEPAGVAVGLVAEFQESVSGLALALLRGVSFQLAENKPDKLKACRQQT